MREVLGQTTEGDLRIFESLRDTRQDYVASTEIKQAKYGIWARRWIAWELGVIYSLVSAKSTTAPVLFETAEKPLVWRSYSSRSKVSDIVTDTIPMRVSVRCESSRRFVRIVSKSDYGNAFPRFYLWEKLVFMVLMGFLDL